MKIRLGTFNLFQFVEPPYSWYVKHDKFSPIQWEEKSTWIKNQIELMNCDIIGFQEVFSKKALRDMLKELGFKYFKTIDSAKTSKRNDKIYVSTIVALASKFPIVNMKRVEVDFLSLKKHHFKGFFKFAREPLKAQVILPNKQKIQIYVCHLKSNRDNEFEYVFTKNDTLEQKREKVSIALKDKYSEALKQRLCEATSLFKDIKNSEDLPTILMTDLNDKEFSMTIEALSNKRYHEEMDEDKFLLVDAYHQFERVIYNPHPEQKEIPRTPTSYFAGKGNVLDYIFISNHFNKNVENHMAKVNDYEILDTHLQKNSNGSLLQSDHAQVVCELKFNKSI